MSYPQTVFQLVPGKEHNIFNTILSIKTDLRLCRTGRSILEATGFGTIHNLCFISLDFVWMPANIKNIHSMDRQVVVDVLVDGRVTLGWMGRGWNTSYEPKQWCQILADANTVDGVSKNGRRVRVLCMLCSVVRSVPDTTGNKRNPYNIMWAYGQVKLTYVDGTDDIMN